jgi:hypothetical protein
MGKVLPKVRIANEDGSNKIPIRKMFDAKRKELTYKFYPENILKFGYDKYPG